jgi:prephenate dehydratase
MNTITYQGIKGAFSYLTAVNAFGKDNHYLPSKTFNDAFENISTGKADFGMIPIENSLIGSIYENYDLLNSYDLKIVGEHFTRIEHCLMTLPGNSMEQIKKVLSHPKALEQCKGFFQKHPHIEAIVHEDTAAAAAEIAAFKHSEYGAIASASAAEIYGLQILKRGIEDDSSNYTRFVTVTKRPNFDKQADKCSLMVQLEHTPGSLAKALVQFEGLNLTKIESRPIRGKPFNYLFYVDFEFIGHRQREIENMLKKFTNVQKLTVFGFYKKGILWTT